MIHNRKRNRLKGYDYTTPGAYFVTFCVKNRNLELSEIKNAAVRLNQYGKIVDDCWHDLPNHYKYIELDKHVIMPDHFHGIVHIVSAVGNGLKPFPTATTAATGLPEIMRGLKTFSSRRINETNPPIPFQWQKSYYDRIIRDDEELMRIREYITNNPNRWGSSRNVRRVVGDE